MARKRLTRKEIVQEDQIRATLVEIWEWSARNSLWLAAGAVLLLAGLGGTYWWEYQSSVHAAQLQDRFADVLAMYHGQVGDAPPPGALPGRSYSPQHRFDTHQQRWEESLQAFQSLANDYPDEDLGAMATYYTALITMEMKSTEEARQILERLLDSSAQSSARHLARNLLARILRENQDTAQVSNLLQAILDDPETPFPQDFVILQLAQNYEELGNAQEALSLYRRLSTEFPTSWYAGTARSRIQELEAEESVPEN